MNAFFALLLTFSNGLLRADDYLATLSANAIAHHPSHLDVVLERTAVIIAEHYAVKQVPAEGSEEVVGDNDEERHEEDDADDDEDGAARHGVNVGS